MQALDTLKAADWLLLLRPDLPKSTLQDVLFMAYGSWLARHPEQPLLDEKPWRGQVGPYFRSVHFQHLAVGVEPDAGWRPADVPEGVQRHLWRVLKIVASLPPGKVRAYRRGLAYTRARRAGEDVIADEDVRYQFVFGNAAAFVRTLGNEPARGSDAPQ